SFILHPFALRALAQLPEVLQGEDAGVVAVTPGDLIRVVPDRRDRDGPERFQLGGLDEAERVGGLDALLAAAGAGGVVAEVLPGIAAAVAVVPLDEQAVVALLAQGQRPHGFRGGTGHGGDLLNGSCPLDYSKARASVRGDKRAACRHERARG